MMTLCENDLSNILLQCKYICIFVYLYICLLKMTSTYYLASFPLSIEEFAN